MKYKGVVIADVHHGVMDAKKLENELELFLKHIKEMNKLDFIIICGDYFDRKLYLNDKSSESSIRVMDRIVSIAKYKEAKIRVIFGTKSHESDQYIIFSKYESDPDIDYKIIYTAQEEELFPNVNVLYLPEEYMIDKKEFYLELMNPLKSYNYIFGHGVIQEVMTMIKKHSTNKSKRLSVPVFTTADFKECCEGEVYFGHYHINSNIDDSIFYVGSYSRWIFGEEEDKGFYELSYDTIEKKYKHKFIINYLAEKYHTIYYGYNDKVFKSEKTLIDELNKVDDMLENKVFDRIRFMFNIPEDYPNPEFVINLLKERYKFDKNVKLEITNGYIDKKRKLNKEEVKNNLNKYETIFDRSQKIENKVSWFIKLKYDKDISSDITKFYLNDDVINKIQEDIITGIE